MLTDSGSVQLSYGEAADGRMIHVSDANQGLACGCICPACKSPLVARKGQQLAAHFAHHVDQSCVAGYETMLHRVAKQVIADRMEVLLPAVAVDDGGRWRELRKALVFRPDMVTLELWQDSIRPDIVARRGDRELVVEIRVTHACTAEKLALLAHRQKAAIEIDLSRLPRHLDGFALEDQVLRLAPREWLWNPHSAKVNAEVQARHAAIRAEVDAEIEAAIKGKVRSLRVAADDPHVTWHEMQAPIEAIKAAGLGGVIDITLDGDVCFAVPRIAWQGWITFSLLKGDRALWPATIDMVRDWLGSRRLIKREFLPVQTRLLSTEWTEVFERVPELRPATAVLLDYLGILRREGILRNDRSGRMEPDPGGVAPARAKLAGLNAANERAKDIRDRAVFVLDAVVPRRGLESFARHARPTAEWADGWDVDAWMGIYNADLKATPDAIARQGGAAYGELVTRLNQLKMLGKPSLSIPDGFTLCLPITNALAVRTKEVAARRLERETAETKRRDEAAQHEAAARKRQADKRLTDLSRLAYDNLMFDAHAWLHNPHPILEGRSVMETGGWMTDDQDAALYDDLKQKSFSKEAERRASNVNDRCREILSTEAVRI